MMACARCGSVDVDEQWMCQACGFHPDAFGDVLRFRAGPDPLGYDPENFAKLADIEVGNFWFESRNRLIAWAVQAYFPAARDVLEIGCGTGFVLAALDRALPAASITGGEVFMESLRIAATRVPRAALYQMDARQIPFRSHFDLVGAFDVLEHIDEDDAALRQVRMALQPGGGLIVTVPQHPQLWSRQDDLALHVRRYTQSQLRSKLARAGLEVLRMTSFVSLLIPAMVLQRRWGSRRGANDAVEAVAMRRGVDALLGVVMRAERSLIERGVGLPIGGSLLAVARRPAGRAG